MYIIYTWRTIRIRNFYPTPCSYHLSAKRPEIKKSWAFVALPFVSTTFWKSSRFRQGLILKCSHFGFFFPWCLMIFIWWCAPILWAHIQCIPMYPNVLFVRSEQVLCVLLAVLLLEACTTRASVHRFAWQDVALWYKCLQKVRSMKLFNLPPATTGLS